MGHLEADRAYCVALNHVFCRGELKDRLAAETLLSDEGIIALDRLCADESSDELDRMAAEVLVHHPVTRRRLEVIRHKNRPVEFPR